LISPVDARIDLIDDMVANFEIIQKIFEPVKHFFFTNVIISTMQNIMSSLFEDGNCCDGQFQNIQPPITI